MKKYYASSELAGLLLDNYKCPLLDCGISFIIREITLHKFNHYSIKAQSILVAQVPKEFNMHSIHGIYYTVVDVAKFLDNKKTNYIVLEDFKENNEFTVAIKNENNIWELNILDISIYSNRANSHAGTFQSNVSISIVEKSIKEESPLPEYKESTMQESGTIISDINIMEDIMETLLDRTITFDELAELIASQNYTINNAPLFITEREESNIRYDLVPCNYSSNIINMDIKNIKKFINMAKEGDKFILKVLPIDETIYRAELNTNEAVRLLYGSKFTKVIIANVVSSDSVVIYMELLDCLKS